MRLVLVHVLSALLLLATVSTGVAAESQASNRTYLKMIDAQKLWNEEGYTEALDLLQEYEPKVEKKPYDQAIVLQYIAHTYVFLDQTEGARGALQKALQLPEIGVPLTAELKLVYGQIVLGDEQFEEARAAIEYWYENTETEKQPSLIFTLGYANYMTGHMERAEELLASAIAMQPLPRKSGLIREIFQMLISKPHFWSSSIFAGNTILPFGLV